MSLGGNGSDAGAHDDGGLARRIRPYALTGGRTRSTENLPLETLIRASSRGSAALPRLALERRQIVQLCHAPISVAELSAHLRVPIGVTRVLLGDMRSEGLVDLSRPATSGSTDRPDIKLLERVLDGLQAL